MGRLVLAVCLVISATADAGTLTTAPNPHDFGPVAVNAGATASTVTITNAGSDTTITGFTMGAGCAELTTSALLPATLADGDSLVVAVTYDPVDRVADSCTVTIADDNAVTDQFVLTGDGLAPEFTATPTSLSFGTVEVGQFAELTLQLTNIGELTGTVQSITSGDAAFTFTVTGGGPPRGVASNESIAVVVRFTPTTGAIVMADLSIATDGAPATVTVPMTGDGLFRDVDVVMEGEADSMVDLGNRRVAVAVTKLVTVTNTGETTTTLALPTSSDSHCVVQPVSPATLPASLAPAASATFNVVVTPTALGMGSCAITVTTDLPTTDTIAIDFNGVAPEVALSLPDTGTLEFGVVDVDTAMLVKAVVLDNTGTDVLAVSACAITGSARFTVLTSCSVMIAAGANATLMVAFDPTVEASETAQLAITVDALSTSTVNVALSGVGSDQRIELSALAASFPDTTVGTDMPPVQHIDVFNPVHPTTGTGETLHISMATTDQSVFVLANQGPFDVAPGGMIRLAITFRPADDVVYDGALVITSDVTGTPMAQVTLHGRGIAAAANEGGGCCQGGRATHGPLALVVLVLVCRRRRRA